MMFGEIGYFNEWSNEDILCYLNRKFGGKMVNDYQRKVRLGISIIETEKPAVLENVDLADLRMHSPCRCVLGQYYSSYSTGIIRLHIDPRLTGDYALDGVEQVDDEEVLDGLWTTEIRNWRERNMSHA